MPKQNQAVSEETETEEKKLLRNKDELIRRGKEFFAARELKLEDLGGVAGGTNYDDLDDAD